MKLSELHALKEVVLAHKKEWPMKEHSKQRQYETLKELILERMVYIETGRMKEQKWLEDINGYLKRLKDKLEVKFLEEKTVEPEGGSKTSESLIP